MVKGVGLAASHRDDEPVAHEDHDLAGLDVGGAFDVTQGLEDREQAAFVGVDLGPLVTHDGVLDGEGVQPQFGVDELELLVSGVLQTDPQEPRRARTQGGQLVAEIRHRKADPIDVHGLVNNHPPNLPQHPAGAHRDMPIR